MTLTATDRGNPIRYDACSFLSVRAGQVSHLDAAEDVEHPVLAAANELPPHNWRRLEREMRAVHQLIDVNIPMA